MSLFITIAVLSLLLTIVGDLIKLLQIPRILRGIFHSTSSDELQKQVNDAREKLERIRQSSNETSHYTYTVKLMRAENELKTVQSKLRNESSMQILKGASVELIATYLLKAIISLVLFIITLRNRYTPVMVFNANINTQPLDGLLSFPTGVPNAISVPFWALSCNSAFRLLFNVLKGK